jgi:hypothetical protein
LQKKSPGGGRGFFCAFWGILRVVLEKPGVLVWFLGGESVVFRW